MNSQRASAGSPTTNETLKLYYSAHKWLLIPMLVILVAFTPLYFLTNRRISARLPGGVLLRSDLYRDAGNGWLCGVCVHGHQAIEATR
jgi:hypothetical protein